VVEGFFPDIERKSGAKMMRRCHYPDPGLIAWTIMKMDTKHHAGWKFMEKTASCGSIK
jgi:hypothetical protein